MDQAIFVRDGKQWVRIPVEQILYMVADDNSTHIHTLAGQYTITKVLKDVLTELAIASVERIHRSYAVNVERIKAIGDNCLHVGEEWLPVGRSYRTEVFQRLKMI